MGLQIPEPAALVDIESVLRRRGHLPIKYGNPEQALYAELRMTGVLLALGSVDYVTYFHPEPIAPYMKRFGQASFRKLVRQLLPGQVTWVPVERLQAITGRATDDYLAFLARLQVLERSDEQVRLTLPIDNLGPSLEHYVSQLCIRELRGSAAWGVTLEGLPRAGGDYDVLAWLEPSIVYVECKSAPPSEVTEGQLRHFWQRATELAPELAILLIDTDQKLDRYVAEKLNPALRRCYGYEAEAGPLESLTDYPGIFFGAQRLYATNSEPSILRQLRRCLQHYYAEVKWRSFYS